MEKAPDELDLRKDEIKILIRTSKGKAFVAEANIKSFQKLTQEAPKVRLRKAKPWYLKLEQF